MVRAAAVQSAGVKDGVTLEKKICGAGVIPANSSAPTSGAEPVPVYPVIPARISPSMSLFKIALTTDPLSISVGTAGLICK